MYIIISESVLLLSKYVCIQRYTILRVALFPNKARRKKKTGFFLEMFAKFVIIIK